MRYAVIAGVPPSTKPFLLAGLVDGPVKSLDEAFKAIDKATEAAVEKAKDDYVASVDNGTPEPDAAEILARAKQATEEMFAAKKSNIKAAFALHKARQERRVAHFDRSCKLEGCIDPKRKPARTGSGHKSRRWTQSFCGPHAGLVNLITKEKLAELRGASKRLRLAV
ncbi:MAG: hypothetical protein A3H69_04155 [Candidatus Sungbacteria bacterium RIFCSPLOWO2_02_FULL_47_9]|nr:MAG: hypothetical protein A3A28_00025 [Candidatus Sungbacteria bacterium RIFCSPLOWO2_01_FULL_47_32]OHA11620.1 MAG: hypothetical protein A3H69_04155 [Candidatus Sungbacteria bacterium RIFCSPLOWO2_02_FULL_47_9]